MNDQEELQALRRLAELEAKSGAKADLKKSSPAEYDPNSPEFQARYGTTSGMTDAEKFRAGYGKAAADTGRGISQIIRMLGPQYAASADAFGLPGQAAVDEAKRQDAPLMKTGAGLAGNITGNVVNALPTVAAGGGLPAATLTGGAMGFVQPVASDESRITNTAIGAGAGAAGNLLGKAVGAVYQGGKALLEPFTQGGRERIAGRMIERFADNPASIAAANSRPTVTGAIPTLAEQTGDAGLARLQDALRAADPQFNNQIGARLAENNAARVGALQSLAGDSATRDAAIAARSAATAPLYQSAVGKTVAVDPALEDLLKRPSIQNGLIRAANLALENGRAPGITADGKITGQALQDLKMSLDAMLKDPNSGIAGAEAGAVKATRDKLIQWMEQQIPEFNAARTGYATASKPLNAMDIGAELAKRATSNTSDLAGNPRMQANALLGMLKDEPGLIQRATGRKGITSLGDVMSPEQLNLLRSVAAETDRAAAVGAAGNGPGSATAQRMASQNVLRQILGPTGLPQSWSENALANTVIGKPLNLVYGGVAEPKIQQELAKAILDPDRARAVLQAAQAQNIQIPAGTLRQLINTASRAVPPAVAVSGQR